MISASNNQVVLSTHQPSEVVKNLADHFRVEVQSDCDEYSITFPSEVGAMTISGVDFYDGYGLLHWKGILKRDIHIKYLGEKSYPLRFLFCLEGYVSHLIDNQSIQYHLDSLKGSITTTPKNTTQILRMPANINLSISSLIINREDFLDKVDCNLETVPGQLASIFRDVDGSETFFYEGNYSIASAECIKKIHSCEYKGLVRMTYMESRALELLTFQLKQYKDDQEPSLRQVLLRRYDVDKIIKAKDFLTENLQQAPSIKDMARKVGINENKLKKGFKIIFDATINQYLRNERLELAKLLLMENNRPIQEVAELVGYQSKGHFAKRFKEKFGVLPKDFVKNLKSKINELELN